MTAIRDEMVAKLTFDNQQFEKGVKQSAESIKRFKESLDFSDTAVKFTGLTKSLASLPFAATGKAAQAGFGMVGSAANLMVDTTDKAMKKLQKSLTGTGSIFDQIKREFGKDLYAKITALPTSITSQIISGGKKRAQNIEQAKFQLQGLLKEQFNWERISQDIDYAVSGTAYGLDAAAKVAAQLKASNIEFSTEAELAANKVTDMKAALRGISGVAAMTNSSYEDIGRIFTTIAGQGRMMTDQLNQFAGRGLNVAATLAEHYKVSEAELREMVTKGKVDFKTFATAMNDAFGEQATKANDTFSGALSNVKASLSRMGEKFATPTFEALRRSFVALIPVFKDIEKLLNKFVKPSFDALADTLAGNVEKALGEIHVALSDILGIELKGGTFSKQLTTFKKVGAELFKPIQDNAKAAFSLKGVDLSGFNNALNSAHKKNAKIYEAAIKAYDDIEASAKEQIKAGADATLVERAKADAIKEIAGWLAIYEKNTEGFLETEKKAADATKESADAKKDDVAETKNETTLIGEVRNKALALYSVETKEAEASKKAGEARKEAAETTGKSFEELAALSKEVGSNIGIDFSDSMKIASDSVKDFLSLNGTDLIKGPEERAGELAQVYRDYETAIARVNKQADEAIKQGKDETVVNKARELSLQALAQQLKQFESQAGMSLNVSTKESKARETTNKIYENAKKTVSGLRDKVFGLLGIEKEENEQVKENAKEYEGIEQIAQDVILGKYKNGEERKKALEDLGLSYAIIQNKVNELMGVEKRHEVTAEDEAKMAKYFGDTMTETGEKVEKQKTNFEKLVDIFAGFRAVLNIVGSAATALWTHVLQPFGAWAGPKILDFVLTTLSDIGVRLVKLNEDLTKTEFFNTKFKAFADAMVLAKDKVVEFFDKAKDLDGIKRLSESFERLKTTLSNIWGKIWGKITEGFKNLGDQASTVDWMQKLLNIVDWVANRIADLFDLISNNEDNIVGFLAGAYHAVIGFGKGLLDAKDKVVEFFKRVSQLESVKALSKSFKNLTRAMKELWDKVFKKVADGFKGLGKSSGKTIFTMDNLVNAVDWMIKKLTALFDFITAHKDDIAKVLSAVYHAFINVKNAVVAFIKDPKGTILKFLGTIRTGFFSFINSVRTGFMTFLHDPIGSIKKGLDTIAGLFKNVQSTISNILFTLFGRKDKGAELVPMSDTVMEMVSGEGGFDQAENSLFSFINTVKNGFTNFLNDPIGSIKKGLDIIVGLFENVYATITDLLWGSSGKKDKGAKALPMSEAVTAMVSDEGGFEQAGESLKGAVYDIGVDIGSSLVTGAKDSVVEGTKQAFGEVSSQIAEVLGGGSGEIGAQAAETAGKSIGDKFGGFLKDLAGKFDIKKGLLAGGGVSLIFLATQIARFFGSLKKTVSSIQEIPGAFVGVLNKLGNTMDAYATKLKTEALFKVAAAIAVLAAAIVALSFVEPERLLTAAEALAMVMGALAAIIAAFALFKSAKAKLVKAEDDKKTNEAQQKMVASVSEFFEGLKGALKKAIGLTSLAFALIALGVTLAIVVGLFHTLTKVDWEHGGYEAAIAVGVFLLALVGTFAALSAVAKNIGFSFGVGMLLIAFALSSLIAPIAILGAIPEDVVGKGLGLLSVLLLEIGIFVAAMGAVKADAILKVAGSMLIFALAIRSLITPISILGAVPEDVIGKGLGLLAVLLLELGIFAGVLGTVVKSKHAGDLIDSLVSAIARLIPILIALTLLNPVKILISIGLMAAAIGVLVGMAVLTDKFAGEGFEKLGEGMMTVVEAAERLGPAVVILGVAFTVFGKLLEAFWPQMLMGLGGFAAAMLVLGGIGMIVGPGLNAISMPLLGIAAAIMAVVLASNSLPAIKDLFQNTFGGIGNVLGGVTDAINGFFTGFDVDTSGFKSSIEKYDEALENMSFVTDDVRTELVNRMKEIEHLDGSDFTMAVENVVGYIQTLDLTHEQVQTLLNETMTRLQENAQEQFVISFQIVRANIHRLGMNEEDEGRLMGLVEDLASTVSGEYQTKIAELKTIINDIIPDPSAAARVYSLAVNAADANAVYQTVVKELQMELGKCGFSDAAMTKINEAVEGLQADHTSSEPDGYYATIQDMELWLDDQFEVTPLTEQQKKKLRAKINSVLRAGTQSKIAFQTMELGLVEAAGENKITVSDEMKQKVRETVQDAANLAFKGHEEEARSKINDLMLELGETYKFDDDQYAAVRTYVQHAFESEKDYLAKVSTLKIYAGQIGWSNTQLSNLSTYLSEISQKENIDGVKLGTIFTEATKTDMTPEEVVNLFKLISDTLSRYTEKGITIDGLKLTLKEMGVDDEGIDTIIGEVEGLEGLTGEKRAAKMTLITELVLENADEGTDDKAITDFLNSLGIYMTEAGDWQFTITESMKVALHDAAIQGDWAEGEEDKYIEKINKLLTLDGDEAIAAVNDLTVRIKTDHPEVPQDVLDTISELGRQLHDTFTSAYKQDLDELLKEEARIRRKHYAGSFVANPNDTTYIAQGSELAKGIKKIFHGAEEVTDEQMEELRVYFADALDSGDMEIIDLVSGLMGFDMSDDELAKLLSPIDGVISPSVFDQIIRPFVEAYVTGTSDAFKYRISRDGEGLYDLSDILMPEFTSKDGEVDWRMMEDRAKTIDKSIALLMEKEAEIRGIIGKTEGNVTLYDALTALFGMGASPTETFGYDIQATLGEGFRDLQTLYYYLLKNFPTEEEATGYLLSKLGTGQMLWQQYGFAVEEGYERYFSLDPVRRAVVDEFHKLYDPRGVIPEEDFLKQFGEEFDNLKLHVWKYVQDEATGEPIKVKTGDFLTFEDILNADNPLEYFYEQVVDIGEDPAELFENMPQMIDIFDYLYEWYTSGAPSPNALLPGVKDAKKQLLTYLEQNLLPEEGQLSADEINDQLAAAVESLGLDIDWDDILYNENGIFAALADELTWDDRQALYNALGGKDVGLGRLLFTLIDDYRENNGGDPSYDPIKAAQEVGEEAGEEIGETTAESATEAAEAAASEVAQGSDGEGLLGGVVAAVANGEKPTEAIQSALGGAGVVAAVGGVAANFFGGAKEEVEKAAEDATTEAGETAENLSEEEVEEVATAAEEGAEKAKDELTGTNSGSVLGDTVDSIVNGDDPAGAITDALNQSLPEGSVGDIVEEHMLDSTTEAAKAAEGAEVDNDASAFVGDTIAKAVNGDDPAGAITDALNQSLPEGSVGDIVEEHMGAVAEEAADATTSTADKKTAEAIAAPVVDVLEDASDQITETTDKVEEQVTSNAESFYNGVETAISEGTGKKRTGLDAESLGITVDEKSFENKGMLIDSSLANGIRVYAILPIVAISRVASLCVKKFEEYLAKFTAVGRDTTSNYASGINASTYPVTQAAISIAQAAEDAIRDRLDEAKRLGEYFGDGYVEGIESKIEAAGKAGAKLAKAAADDNATEEGAHSPSRVAMRLGNYFGMGYVIGINAFRDKAGQAGAEMADRAITALQTPMQIVQDVLNSDLDSEPVIRPVLDLSNIQNGARRINGLLPSGARTLGSISASMANRRETTNADVVSAIVGLSGQMENTRGDTYNINGITYDDGSNIVDAVQSLVRAARVERRR